MGKPAPAVLAVLTAITDRNYLDDLLFATISCCRGLMRQPLVQVESRADLRQKLPAISGGVVIATIQKLLPEEPVVARRWKLLWRDA